MRVRRKRIGRGRFEQEMHAMVADWVERELEERE